VKRICGHIFTISGRLYKRSGLPNADSKPSVLAFTGMRDISPKEQSLTQKLHPLS
jgi:hypothetical protein